VQVHIGQPGKDRFTADVAYLRICRDVHQRGWANGLYPLAANKDNAILYRGSAISIDDDTVRESDRPLRLRHECSRAYDENYVQSFHMSDSEIL
jgi:hypothetical protein